LLAPTVLVTDASKTLWPQIFERQCIYPRDSEPAERAKSAQPDDTGALIFTDNEGHGF
jgi:hypothetical protein